MKKSISDFRQDLSHGVELLDEISRNLEDIDELAYVYNCNDTLEANTYRSILGDIDEDLEPIMQEVEQVKNMLMKYNGGKTMLNTLIGKEEITNRPEIMNATFHETHAGMEYRHYNEWKDSFDNEALKLAQGMMVDDMVQDNHNNGIPVVFMHSPEGDSYMLIRLVCIGDKTRYEYMIPTQTEYYALYSYYTSGPESGSQI